jgi:hypothetical protein
MNYNDLIQLYFERSTAMQAYWNLYVLIVGGLLAFSSLRNYHVDRVGSVRLVCLQKSGCHVRHDSAAFRRDPGNQTIRFQWNKRRELETSA